MARYPYRATVGSRGGTIEPGDGFKLIVPAGMFRSDCTLEIQEPRAPRSTPSGKTAVGDCYPVTKVSGPDPNSGYQFDVFVPFTGTYTGRERDKLNVHYNVNDDDPTTWQPAPVKVDPGGNVMGGRFSSDKFFGYFCVFKDR